MKKQEKLNNSSIYELELHEIVKISDSTEVLRVPGGWLYRSLNKDYYIDSTCFVPFSSEFKVLNKVDQLNGRLIN